MASTSVMVPQSEDSPEDWPPRLPEGEVLPPRGDQQQVIIDLLSRAVTALARVGSRGASIRVPKVTLMFSFW